MFKIVLSLTHGHQLAHKLPNEEEEMDTYFEIQRAMQAVAQDHTTETLPLGESLLVQSDQIIGCELKGPRTQ